MVKNRGNGIYFCMSHPEILVKSFSDNQVFVNNHSANQRIWGHPTIAQ
jgi:hypothetical protein